MRIKLEVFFLISAPMFLMILLQFAAFAYTLRVSLDLIYEYNDNLYLNQQNQMKQLLKVYSFEFNQIFQMFSENIQTISNFEQKILSGTVNLDSRFVKPKGNGKKLFKGTETPEFQAMAQKNNNLASIWGTALTIEESQFNIIQQKQLLAASQTEVISRAIRFENNQKFYARNITIKDIYEGFVSEGMLSAINFVNITLDAYVAPKGCLYNPTKFDTRCRQWFLEPFDRLRITPIEPLLIFSQAKTPFLASNLCKRQAQYAPDSTGKIQPTSCGYSVNCLNIKLSTLQQFFEAANFKKSKTIMIDPRSKRVLYNSITGLPTNITFLANATMDIFQSDVNKSSEFLKAVYANIPKRPLKKQGPFDGYVAGNTANCGFNASLASQQISLQQYNFQKYSQLVSEINYQDPSVESAKSFIFKAYDGEEYFVALNSIVIIEKLKTIAQGGFEPPQMAGLFELQDLFLVIDVLPKSILTTWIDQLTRQIKTSLKYFGIGTLILCGLFLIITGIISYKVGVMIEIPIIHMIEVLQRFEKEGGDAVLDLIEESVNFQEGNSVFLSLDLRILFESFIDIFRMVHLVSQDIFTVDNGHSLLQLNYQITFFKQFNNIRVLGICYNNIGNIHFQNQRYLEAMEYFHQALLFAYYEAGIYKEEGLGGEENEKNNKDHQESSEKKRKTASISKPLKEQELKEEKRVNNKQIKKIHIEETILEVIFNRYLNFSQALYMHKITQEIEGNQMNNSLKNGSKILSPISLDWDNYERVLLDLIEINKQFTYVSFGRSVILFSQLSLCHLKLGKLDKAVFQQGNTIEKYESAALFEEIRQKSTSSAKTEDILMNLSQIKNNLEGKEKNPSNISNLDSKQQEYTTFYNEEQNQLQYWFKKRQNQIKEKRESILQNSQHLYLSSDLNSNQAFKLEQTHLFSNCGSYSVFLNLCVKKIDQSDRNLFKGFSLQSKTPNKRDDHNNQSQILDLIKDEILHPPIKRLYAKQSLKQAEGQFQVDILSQDQSTTSHNFLKHLIRKKTVSRNITRRQSLEENQQNKNSSPDNSLSTIKVQMEKSQNNKFRQSLLNTLYRTETVRNQQLKRLRYLNHQSHTTSTMLKSLSKQNNVQRFFNPMNNNQTDTEKYTNLSYSRGLNDLQDSKLLESTQKLPRKSTSKSSKINKIIKKEDHQQIQRYEFPGDVLLFYVGLQEARLLMQENNHWQAALVLTELVEKTRIYLPYYRLECLNIIEGIFKAHSLKINQVTKMIGRFDDTISYHVSTIIAVNNAYSKAAKTCFYLVNEVLNKEEDDFSLMVYSNRSFHQVMPFISIKQLKIQQLFFNQLMETLSGDTNTVDLLESSVNSSNQDDGNQQSNQQSLQQEQYWFQSINPNSISINNACPSSRAFNKQENLFFNQDEQKEDIYTRMNQHSKTETKDNLSHIPINTCKDPVSILNNTRNNSNNFLKQEFLNPQCIETYKLKHMIHKTNQKHQDNSADNKQLLIVDGSLNRSNQLSPSHRQNQQCRQIPQNHFFSFSAISQTGFVTPREKNSQELIPQPMNPSVFLDNNHPFYKDPIQQREGESQQISSKNSHTIKHKKIEIDSDKLDSDIQANDNKEEPSYGDHQSSRLKSVSYAISPILNQPRFFYMNNDINSSRSPQRLSQRNSPERNETNNPSRSGSGENKKDYFFLDSSDILIKKKSLKQEAKKEADGYDKIEQDCLRNQQDNSIELSESIKLLEKNVEFTPLQQFTTEQANTYDNQISKVSARGEDDQINISQNKLNFILHFAVRKAILSYFENNCRKLDWQKKLTEPHLASKSIKIILFITDQLGFTENKAYIMLTRLLYQTQMQLLILQLHQEEFVEEQNEMSDYYINNKSVIKYFYTQEKLLQYIRNKRETMKSFGIPLLFEKFSI